MRIFVILFLLCGLCSAGSATTPAQETATRAYVKKVSDAIGAIWYSTLEKNSASLSPGKVKLRFFVTKKGGVEDFEITSKDTDKALADIAKRAVFTAKIPPIPQEIYPVLTDGRHEINLTFTLNP